MPLKPECNRKHIEDYLGWAIFIGSLLLFLTSCATPTLPIRLGPGECVVLEDKQQVIVAGSECQMRRLYR
jgi:hypothetical protein